MRAHTQSSPRPHQSHIPRASHRHRRELNGEGSPESGSERRLQPPPPPLLLTQYRPPAFNISSDGTIVNITGVLDTGRTAWESSRRFCCYWWRPWRFHPRWAQRRKSQAVVGECRWAVPWLRSSPGLELVTPGFKRTTVPTTVSNVFNDVTK